MVALFFACQAGSQKKDGLLYRWKVSSEHTFTIDKKIKDSPFAEPSSTGHQAPFFLDPPHENPRIRAQDSIFFYIPIHLADKPIDKIGGFEFETFEIPEKFKSKIIRQLHMVGVNDFKLYPDLHGLGTYLNWKIIDRFPG